jgi:radical SAM protein with 4Fe4S-binding SPASM domain
MISEQSIMKEQIKHQNMKDLAEYQLKLRQEPQLRFLFFELTDKCNLRCKHCGSSCKDSNSNFLDLDAIYKTMDSVMGRYGSNSIMICLTGGEPLLYPNVFDVIKRAHVLGFPVGITTNGTQINDDIAARLAFSGLNTIAVSLDGIGKTHDDFRLMKGCFDKALNGIHSLKKAGIEPQVLTVVHKNNFVQLEQIYDLLCKEDIYSWRLVNVDPIGRASINNDLLLNANEMIGLFEFIRNKRFDIENEMEVTYGCSHFVTYEYENEIRDFYFQCGAGTIVASIMANGNIGACLDIERRQDLVQGNIYKDDFIDVWENKFGFFRTDRTRQSKKCCNCSNRDICMGDSAHTWNYDEGEPGYCVAKMIAEVKT